MTAATPDIEAARRRYLDEAAAVLSDLVVREREELLSDIADAIAELADTPDYHELVARLGAPEEFAREIRDSSGAVHAQTPAPPMGVVVGGDGSAAGGVDRTVQSLEQAATWLRWVGVEFEPLWWLIRAFIIALPVAWAFQQIGDVLLLVTIGILVGSIVHGARTRRRKEAGQRARFVRGVGIVGGGLFVLWSLIVVVSNGAPFMSNDEYVDQYASVEAGIGLSSRYGVVENVYAFDADGNQLADVRLYDQNGQPLDVGAAGDVGPLRRHVIDGHGQEVLNAFPIRYLDPETKTVVDPQAGWPEAPPVLVSADDAPERAAAAKPAAAATPEVNRAAPALR